MYITTIYIKQILMKNNLMKYMLLQTAGYFVIHFTLYAWQTEETGVPCKDYRLTPSHWQLSHMPGRDLNPGSGEKQ